MFDKAQFDNAIADAQAQIDRVRDELGNVECPDIDRLRIRLNELNHENIEAVIEGVPSGYANADKGNDYVYVIQALEDYPEAVRELRAMFEAVRNTADDYARINLGGTSENTIYVGRSKTPRKRLREHLGLASEGVYALHLQRWATAHEAEIEIAIICFSKMDNLYVQAIEDGVWAHLLPAFGRKGER